MIPKSVKSKNRKIVEKIITKIREMDYVVDRYGNYKKTVNGDEYRYKFNATSYRHETKVGGTWMKISGTYYKNVNL